MPNTDEASLNEAEKKKASAMLAFNFALQIYYFHYQITFYSIICLVVLGIYYIVEGIRAGALKPVLIATLISILAVTTGVLSNYSKIISLFQLNDRSEKGLKPYLNNNPFAARKLGTAFINASVSSLSINAKLRTAASDNCCFNFFPAASSL